MTTLAVTACVLVFAICLPATCKGQYYWGAYGWRQYWQPSSSAVCDRAYPARQTDGYVHSCRYYCSGFPLRYSFEQDGTPCYTNRWIAGACYAGRCQTGWWPVQPPAAPQAPATAAPATTTEHSSLGSQGWSWPSEDADGQRCTRADPQVPEVRRSCRYICKGWPIRHEDEADGTACQLSWWREGFCFRGHCQRNYPVPPVPSDDNKIEGGNDLVRNLRCRNYKERVKVDGVVRSCKFVCKQRKKAFVANEENGTPCAAFPGQNGFCDNGVCKAVEATPATSEASQAPTEHETEETMAVVSPVTEAAPLTAATITAEGATAAETGEAATTVASAGEEEPEAAAPAVRSPWTPGFVGVQCDRAYPSRVVDGRALKCRFLCRGYPLFWIGFEKDGTPCRNKKTLEGVCFNGNCKPLPPSTDATTVNEETTTVQSYVTEAYALSTSKVEETTTDARASTDDTRVASKAATAAEGEVSDSAPARESTASAAADVEDTSAATDISRTGTEGKVSDATSASESGASAAADVEETSVATDSTSVTGTEGAVSNPTPVSESGASDSADVEQTSTDSESNRSDADDEDSEATSASDSEASATSDVQETPAPIESEVHESASTKASVVTVGEESKSVGEEESSPERVETSTVDRSTGATGKEVTAGDQATRNEEPEGATVASEAAVSGKGYEHESVEPSSESRFLTTEAQAGAEEVSTRSATAQHDDLTSTEKASSSDEAGATAAPTGTHDEAEVASTASKPAGSYSESSTQIGPEESTDTSAGRDEQADQASSDGESESTVVQSSSDVTSAPAAATEETSEDTAINTDDSVSESATASGREGEHSTSASATVGASSDKSAQATVAGKVIAERTEETVVVTTQEDLTTNVAEGVAVTGGAATEGLVEGERPTGSVTPVKESEKKESTEALFGDANTTVSSGEELTINKAAQTTVDSHNTAATEVAAESVFATNTANQPAEGDFTTPSLSSAGTQTQQDVLQGTEGSLPGGATEGTTAADESATVKVITTITRKEILRPVDSEATLVRETSSTTDAQTTTGSPNTAANEVTAEGVFITNEGSESQPAESDSTTPSFSSALSETQQNAVQGTEASFTDQATEGTTDEDESATVKVITTITRKEILRPVDDDATQADATLVQETSSKTDAQTTMESPNTAAIEVAAESVLTTNEGKESHPGDDSTTPSLSSAAIETQHDVVQGTEASFADRETEGTTAADESATVKVITTIKRKEIVRPIDPDDSQPDATLVQKTSSTSVQTLPLAVLDESAESSPVVPAAGTPSESSVVVAGADVENTEAVSSGPSLVITDFVQKTASSSKDSATTPSVQEESKAAAENDSEVNVSA